MSPAPSRFVCIGDDGSPIVGKIDFIFEEHPPDPAFGLKGARLAHPKHVITLDLEGVEKDLPSHQGRYPQRAAIRPNGTYRWQLWEDPFNNNEITCKLKIGDDGDWWSELLQLPTGSRGDGIRIGLIDMPFAPSGGLSQVRVLNANGKSGAGAPIHSHGRNMCELLCSTDRGGGRGSVAPGARVTLFDVSRGDPEKWWQGEISAGIDYLALKERMDLIMIAGGSYDVEPSVNEAISRAIHQARLAGTLVIAAAGNDLDKEDVAYPAALHDVVAIGGVAAPWGPEGMTYVEMLQHEAIMREPKAIGGIGSSEARVPMFAVSTLSRNKNTDHAVGPGAGIIVTNAAGNPTERRGSSFATAIVTGTLACILGADERYRDLQGERRWAYARSRLHDFCEDLGIHTRHQGWGLARASKNH